MLLTIYQPRVRFNVMFLVLLRKKILKYERLLKLSFQNGLIILVIFNQF